MSKNTIIIDGTKITDFASFHTVFKEEMGFPDFYGNNMNAWIDCMSDIHEDTKMSKILLPSDQPLYIRVNDTQTFSKTCPDVLNSFVDCTAFVNKERLKVTSLAPIILLFT